MLILIYTYHQKVTYSFLPFNPPFLPINYPYSVVTYHRSLVSHPIFYQWLIPVLTCGYAPIPELPTPLFLDGTPQTIDHLITC